MTAQALTPQLTRDQPWPGLQSYTEESRDFFFGRQAETDALLRLVRRERLSVFYGQSGLGKTSLLHAGLFPGLRRETNLLPVPLRLDYTDGAPPLTAQLKQALIDAFCEHHIEAQAPTRDESLWVYFHRADVDFWNPRNELIVPVLVFDQFEERFTVGRRNAQADADAEAFLVELSQLVENRPPPALRAQFDAQPESAHAYEFDKQTCKVLLSLREDFLPELENLRGLFPAISDNTLRLQGMNDAQARDVVLKPGGHLVSEPVATEVVHFVGGTDSRQVLSVVEPVLLSVVLFELNQRRRRNEQSQITSDLLTGSREQILEGFYESALSGLPPQACFFIEEGLLTSTGRRDSLAWEDVLVEYAVGEETLLTLINRHLLRRVDRPEGSRVELVHDRLAEVVRRRREIRHEEERQAKERETVRRREQDLMRQREDQHRRVRHLAWISFLLALFGIAMAALGLYAWKQGARAKAALQESQRQRGRAEEALADAEKQKQQVEAALKEAEASRSEAQKQKARAEVALKESEQQRTKVEELLAKVQNQEAATETALKATRAQQEKTEEALKESHDQRVRLESMMNFMLHDLSDKLRPIGRVDVLRTVTEQVLAHYTTEDNGDESDDSLTRRFTAFGNLGYALAIQGDTAKALAAYRACLEIAQELSWRGNRTTNWLGEISLCHQHVGEILEARGDSREAFEEFDEGMKAAQRLVQEAPRDPLWRHYSLLSHASVGDVLWLQGDKTRALTNVMAALEIAESLVREEPDNVAWRRDLLICYSKVGSLLFNEWGVVKAEGYCTNALNIAQQLASLDPDNLQWQSDLAASHVSVGEVYAGQSKATEAQAHFREAVRIRQQLAKRDPSNTEWHRDLLRSYFKIYGELSREGDKSKMGGLVHDVLQTVTDTWRKGIDLVQRLFSHEDQTKLLQTFQGIMKDAEELVEKDPGNSDWQHDLARSHSLLGDLLFQEGKSVDALEEYRKALTIRQHLAMVDTNATAFRYWLSESHCNTAAALWRLARHEEAAEEARQALRVFEALISRWPKNALFMEGPKFGTQDLRRETPIGQKQFGDLIAAFKRGFGKAKNKAAHARENQKDREDYASYCMEKAVAFLLLGNRDQAMADAAMAIDIWQELLKTDPSSILYQERLKNARVALGAFQIFNHQPQSAIANALQGFQLDPAMVEFKAIRAMGYVIDNQSAKADAILLENRNLKVGSEQTFPEAVIDDLRRLRDKGLINTDLDKFKKYMGSGSASAPE